MLFCNQIIYEAPGSHFLKWTVSEGQAWRKRNAPFFQWAKGGLGGCCPVAFLSALYESPWGYRHAADTMQGQLVTLSHCLSLFPLKPSLLMPHSLSFFLSFFLSNVMSGQPIFETCTWAARMQKTDEGTHVSTLRPPAILWLMGQNWQHLINKSNNFAFYEILRRQ